MQNNINIFYVVRSSFETGGGSFSVPSLVASHQNTTVVASRTLHRPSLKTPYDRMSYFVESYDPEARRTRDESIDESIIKWKKVKGIIRILKSYSKAVIQQLDTEAAADRTLTGLTWGKIPVDIRNKYATLLERLAAVSYIPIDICVDSWMAMLLLGESAHNTLGYRV